MTNPTTTTDAATARAEWDETFDAVAACVCDDQHGPDALHEHVAPGSVTSWDVSDWTDAELSEAYSALAGVARYDDEWGNPHADRDRLEAVCQERAEWLDAAAEAQALDAEAFPVLDAARAHALSPAEHRAEAIAEDAAVVLAHLLDAAVTFPARAKVEQAEEFSYLAGGSTLAVPSKLSAVTVFADTAARLAAVLDARPDHGVPAYYPARVYHGAQPDGKMVAVVMVETVPGDPGTIAPVGFLQDKHLDWVAPLLDTDAAGLCTERGVRVHVTAVTGGTEGKPTRGVNVVITGAADAIRQRERAAAQADREARAYGSGNRAAVEAATV